MNLPPQMLAALGARVANGEIPGLGAAVVYRDQVAAATLGTHAAHGEGGTVTSRSLFRISSMTKPITGVATMLLVEDNVLRLDEPVDRLLPELANRRVLRALDAELDDTVPAHRAITVEDLLTFRCGWGVFMAPPDTYPLQRAFAQLALGQGPPQPQLVPAPDEWLRRLGTLPLMAQPGERWLYNTGADILGVLIARAAQQPFADFLAERIFAPLGMHDTAFHGPAARMTTSYIGADVYDPPDGQWSKPPRFASGAAGLVSSLDDLVAWSRAILEGRLLSRDAFARMTADHLAPGQHASAYFPSNSFQSPGRGFGYCGAAFTGPDPEHYGRSPGAWGWDGGLGSQWYVDPARGLCAIYLSQRAWWQPIPGSEYADFWHHVHVRTA
ncbi:MAG TPA: serine hydrolase domain-containing protein [Kofleriaceae bacterium]